MVNSSVDVKDNKEGKTREVADIGCITLVGFFSTRMPHTVVIMVEIKVVVLSFSMTSLML